MYGRDEKIVDAFYGEYRNGILGKKNKVILYAYEKHIEGKAARYWDGKFFEYDCELAYEHIKTIGVKYIEGSKCIEIEYMINQDNRVSVVSANTITVYFPNITNIEEAVECIEKIRKIVRDNLEAKKHRELEMKKQKQFEEQQHKEECEQYFQKCFDFHITNNNNPYYELQYDELFFACIYIDKQKNLNFLRIDGMNQEESNAYIPFEKIHYYEKAGSVHYATDINGTYSSFGGRITGGNISKKATLLGGMLLGPMGMAAGAVLSHKPTNMEMPQSSFDISSEIQKIDDRSVILNYFSDNRQQYIDIELPADIYNFLQTHLSEKKYGIVLEIEKKKAMKQHDQNEQELLIQNTTNMISDNDTDTFESKVKKLKLMYDNGLLTEEEFASEKKKLLSQL